MRGVLGVVVLGTRVSRWSGEGPPWHEVPTDRELFVGEDLPRFTSYLLKGRSRFVVCKVWVGGMSLYGLM